MKKIISSAIAVLMCHAFVLPVWAQDFTSRVEAEWCEMTNIPASESGENNLPVYRSSATFSNGLAVNHTNTTQIPDGGWYMSYDIVVNADGIYNLSFMTSAVGSKYTSPYSISINGGEPAEVLSGMKIADGYNANWAKYSMSTYLEKGSNTITVEITDYTEQSKSSSPRTVFYFDYFDVEFSENQGVRAEGESYFDASTTSGISAATDATANSALTGDKRYLKFGGDAVSADETRSVKVKVYAPESGEYKMNTICSKLGVGWAGKWDLSDENGNVYPLNAETVSFVRDVLPSASNAFCEYNLNTPVYLDSGYNTLTITAYTRGSGGFATFVDYIAFTKSSSGSLTIEAEACTEPGYWTAANGRLTLNQTDEVWGYDPVGDAFEVYYDFEIAEESSYHLYFDMAAANSSNNNVSRLEISVDGEKWKSFDTDNLSYYGKTTSGISSTYAPAVYMYEKSYTLTEGSHSIGIRVTEPIAPDDRRLQYYADVDKIMILPDDRRAEIAEAAISVPYLAAGDSTELSFTILDNYENSVNTDDFTISYEKAAILLW